MKIKAYKRPDRTRMKTLSCSIAFDKKTITKAADGSLFIEGYANTVSVDRVMESVLPSAFEKNLPMFMQNAMLLYMHDWDKPMGKVIEAKITNKGLWVKAQISNAKDCEDYRTKISEGILKTFSIGYNELLSEFDSQKEIKVIKELELLEISVVTIPANAQALFGVSGESAPEALPVADENESEASAEGGDGKGHSVADLKTVMAQFTEAMSGIGALVAELKTMKGSDEMKVQTTVTKNAAPAAAVVDAAKQEGAPTTPAADPAAPAAAQAEGEDKYAKMMEKLEAMSTSLKSIEENCSKICKALEMESSEDPAKAGESDGEKDVAELSEDEAEAELLAITEQLEAAEQV